MTVIAIQALGDLANAVRGHVVKGALGFAIAGALFFYLLRSDVRSVFASGRYRAFVDEIEKT